MSDTINKILDRIPYSDGAFRRRITAGAIFITSIYIGVDSAFELDLNPMDQVSKSVSVGVLALLLVYAMGALVEVVAELFIARIVGSINYALTRILHPFRKTARKRELDLASMISEAALTNLEKMPEIIQTGIKHPFGKNRETPWDYFCDYGTQSEMHLSRKLKTRNQDVLVIVTSISLSILFVFYPLLIELQYGQYQQSQIQGLDETKNFIQLLFVFVLAVFPIAFLTTYVSTLKQSIVSILEFKCIIASHYHASNPYNKQSQTDA